MNFHQTFPLVFLLNLARRQDRRARCLDLFDEHGLRVERFPACDAGHMKSDGGYQTKGRYAHALSVRRVIREAKRRKAPAVFIFEDDVAVRENWLEILSGVKLPADWGLFYLGCQHVERPVVRGSGLVRVTGALDTHAFGIKAEWYDFFLKALRGPRLTGEAIKPATDVSLARLQALVPSYAVYPNLAWQEDELSDLAEGSYSNYHADGTQKWWDESMAGLTAEILGGRSWKPASAAGQAFRGWFRQSTHPEMTAPRFATANLGTTSGEAPRLKPAVSCGGIAFLFLVRGAHHHPRIWENYWSGQDRWTVYSHIAEKESKPRGWMAQTAIQEWLPTKWGDISLIRAQLALIKAALRNPDNEWFFFLSESCVPIRPFRDFRRLLEFDGRSRFGWNDYWEVLASHPDKASRAHSAPAVPPSLFTFHSQWIMLDREAAELAVEDDFTEYFNSVHAADECYMGTVLRMKGYPLRIKVAPFDLTWTRWPGVGSPHPRTLNHIRGAEAAELSGSGKFFARKFSPHSNIGKFELHNAL